MKPFVLNSLCGALIFWASGFTVLADAPLPEPGPVNGGLRLRLVVAPDIQAGPEGYDVRLDLLNVTNHPIVLRAGWGHDGNTGDFKDYLEAAISIETYPPIAPWVGQVMGPHRTLPQPECVLKAGEILTVRWHTAGRRLKNKVTDPLDVQNPDFPVPGQYSVHATVLLSDTNWAASRPAVVAMTLDQAAFPVPGYQSALYLRSNEQLVSAGGSLQMPRHTYGQLETVDSAAKTARLNLGSQQKVQRGDQFQALGRMWRGPRWKLVLTNVWPTFSDGILESIETGAGPITMFPKPGSRAVLIQSK